MFLTSRQFEEPGMTALAAKGQQYWRAVVAEFPVLPWYLFLHKGQVLDACVNQVMLVAWEESLIDIIEATPAPWRGVVYRVDPDPPRGLRFRVVSSLWRASEQGNSEGHLALVALEGASQPVDTFLQPVPPEHVGELVYQAPPSAYPHGV